MANVIRNDGKNVSIPDEGDGRTITLPFGTEEGTITIHKGFHGNNVISVTHDFRVQVMGYVRSRPVDPEVLRERLAVLGLQLEMDNPADRVESLRDEGGNLVLNWEAIMAAAGYGPEAKEWETTGDGLVFQICLGRRHPEVGPYSAKEIRKEAQRMVREARRWLRQTFPGLKRTLKPDEYTVVQLYRQGRRSDIRRVKVGETAEVPWQGGSYFGSGGAWGRYEVYGEISQTDGEYEDNGFCRSGTYHVTFSHGPAAIYTSGGDGINGGRTFFRQLIVAE